MYENYSSTNCAVGKTEYGFLHLKQFGFPLIGGD